MGLIMLNLDEGFCLLYLVANLSWQMLTNIAITSRGALEHYSMLGFFSHKLAATSLLTTEETLTPHDTNHTYGSKTFLESRTVRIITEK